MLMLTIEPLYTYHAILNIKERGKIMEQKIIFLEKNYAIQLEEAIQVKTTHMNTYGYKLTSISVWIHPCTYKNYAMLVFTKN